MDLSVSPYEIVVINDTDNNRLKCFSSPLKHQIKMAKYAKYRYTSNDNGVNLEERIKTIRRLKRQERKEILALERKVWFVTEEGEFYRKLRLTKKRRQKNTLFFIIYGDIMKKPSQYTGRYYGKITFYDSKKEFGFIKSNNVPEKIFFHISKCDKKLKQLKDKKSVEIGFDIVHKEKGLSATNISIFNEAEFKDVLNNLKK